MPQILTVSHLESKVDDAISRTRDLLSILSQGATREQVFMFLDDDPSVPLWVQEEGTGWTVLHFAASREDSLMVERFLQAGANWNLRMSTPSPLTC